MKTSGRSAKRSRRRQAREDRCHLSYETLEQRQLLAAHELVFWDFGDADGTTFKNAAITGLQADDVEWRSDRAAFQTGSGNLEVVDDGSNQYFTDLRQQSNTSNENPLDLTGHTDLRLEINFDSWDLSNANVGAVQRFDLKRQGGTVYAHFRFVKTATASEMFVGFNDETVRVPMPMASSATAVTLDLDLDANVANYDVGGTTGTLTPTNSPITLTNETLNFGVFTGFLGSSSSPDTIVIDSMGLRVIPQVTRSVQTGDWTDPNTWDNGVPDDLAEVIVGQGDTVTLDGSDHIADTLIVHGTLDVEEDGTSRNLSAGRIHVNSGGVFQIGTAADRFDDGEFAITLTGTDVTADHIIETATGSINITDNDGFLMAAMGGQLQLFGEDRVSFTKLGATAEVGATSVIIENIIERNFDGTTSAASDGQLNWSVGDEIVIASSSRDYSHEEVRTITAIASSGTQTELTLDSALNHRHYGEIEVYDNGTRTWDLDLRAEVALLSRSITIEGTQDTDNAFGDRANYGTGASQNLGIGGHTMIMKTAGEVIVDGVRFNKMGQTGNVGRYPIHWHLGEDRSGDVLRNSSITNSNNRAITIHGTHGVLVEGNVLHDIHGHGVFIEDAVETNNQFLHNIALGIHKVGGDNTSLSDPFIVDTHDVVFQDATKELSSAAFWITNPDNEWVGNISAGSEGTGFWFIFPTTALGASANNPAYDGLDPSAVELGTFLHNSSHASPLGLVIDRGADIELEIGDPIFNGNGPNAGRYYPPSPLFMQHYTAYKHGGAAIYTNVDDGYIFDEFKYADNFISSFQLRSKTNSNTLYVGHSRGNADTSEVSAGHSLYNGNVILKDNHYAGFTGPNGYFFNAELASKRQHYLLSGTTFENDGTANQLKYDNPNGSGLFDSQIPLAGIDVDGTLTGHVGGGAGYTIIPDHPFHRDSNDFVPSGWEALVTDYYYAGFELVSIDGLSGTIDNVRITNPVGASISKFSGQQKLNVAVKLGWGDYVVDFPDGLGNFATDGFKYVLRLTQGDEFVPDEDKAAIIKFEGIGGQLVPKGVPHAIDMETLRAANQTAWHNDANGDVWMKIFYEINLDLFGNQMEMLPVQADAVAPQIESVVINDGEVQRSMVSELALTFSEVVNGVDANSFMLMNDSVCIPVTPTVSVVGGKTVATLTFSGSGIIGGSLADGDYTLTTSADLISDAAGNQLDGDGDGQQGGNRIDEFFRFYGDTNADRNVNVIDLLTFRQAFGVNGIYNAAVDYNGDGWVNVFDLLQFRRRFGTSI